MAKIDEKLAKYNAKRNFKKTAEPAGIVPKSKHKQLTYMIQKHAASHLHYDFRLEWEGVLKSWAVARGPSLDPAQKRLAVQVEDHPLGYANFEGTIPQGEYGGGTVMLWDRGYWEPLEDIEKGLAKGRLNFCVQGERLQGQWHLIRMGGKASGDRKQNWLLVKSHDEFADSTTPDALLERYTTSIKTSRSMQEISGQAKAKRETPAIKIKPAAELKKVAAPSALPVFIEPQLATLVDVPPTGSGWLHEIKFDGYRAIVRIENGTVQMLTRAGNDWTTRFRGIAKEFEKLNVESAVIDGEVVRPDAAGHMSFHDLQQAMGKDRQEELHYYAFDLMYLNGEDLCKLPLSERKKRLRVLIPSDHQHLNYSDDFTQTGDEVLHNACSLKLEGIISKRADAPYRPGRSEDWLKSKCLHEQEFVIGGFTYQPKHPDRLAALLIGYYENKELKFAGKVGTGFTQAESKELLSKLEKLKQTAKPFGTVPTAWRRNAEWVKPQYVAQIFFSEWTDIGMLRHPSYNGLREDKKATEVVREYEHPAPKLKKPEDNNFLAKSAITILGIPLSHPDKALYPEIGATKQEIAEYYAKIAPLMLPHVAGFPISLLRCPNGQNKTCFFQRHNDIQSKFLKPIPIELSGEITEFITLDKAEGLIDLAQMGALEIHAWGAKAKTNDQPERIVFDFDPDEELTFEKVKAAALEMRERLQKLGMESFLKTTGGKGLHVVLPFQKGPSWEMVEQFSEAMATLMVEDAPDLYTINNRKTVRKGKIFIDYLRNAKAASAIAPYSTRAKANASISVPLNWTELKKLKAPNLYTIRNLPKNLENPWLNFFQIKQKLRFK